MADRIWFKYGETFGDDVDDIGGRTQASWPNVIARASGLPKRNHHRLASKDCAANPGKSACSKPNRYIQPNLFTQIPANGDSNSTIYHKTSFCCQLLAESLADYQIKA